MAKQDDYVRYTIRVPADLYAVIQEAAGEKSVNAEIVARLEQSVVLAKTINDYARAEERLFEAATVERDLRRQIELLEEQVAILRDKEDRKLDLSDEGIVAVLKSISAIEAGLAQIFFFHRDVELDGFIADQARQGKVMTRTDAVEFILREYLTAKGYVFEPPQKRPGLRSSGHQMTYGEFFASEEGQELLRQRDAIEAAKNGAPTPLGSPETLPTADDAQGRQGEIFEDQKASSASGIRRTRKLRGPAVAKAKK